MKTLLYFPTAILLVCMLAFTTSCDKEDVEPELVPITTTGENTMGFYVDGEPMNAEGEYSASSWCTCGVEGSINNDDIVYILASGNEPQWTTVIYFPVDLLNTSNEIVIDESIYFNMEIRYRDNSPLGGRAFRCDSLHQGKIKMLRMDDQVLAGTFEFEAIHKESGETVSVTNGRFDVSIK